MGRRGNMLTYKNVGFNFGLEREHFVCSNYAEGYDWEQCDFALPPDKVARDNAGYLVEARGDFSKDPYTVVHNLKARELQIVHVLALEQLRFAPFDKVKLPERLKLEAYKKFGLPPKDKLVANLYDNALTDKQLEFQYAGTHLSISKIEKISLGDQSTFRTVPFDHAPIIKWLDKYFDKEISEAGRLKGSYSIKMLEGGLGLEYRSIPSSVPMTYGIPGAKYERANMLEALILMKEDLKL